MSNLSTFFGQSAQAGNLTLFSSTGSVTVPSVSKYIGYGALGAGGDFVCTGPSCAYGGTGGGFSWWDGAINQASPFAVCAVVGVRTCCNCTPPVTSVKSTAPGFTCIYACGGFACGNLAFTGYIPGGCASGGLINRVGGCSFRGFGVGGSAGGGGAGGICGNGGNGGNAGPSPSQTSGSGGGGMGSGGGGGGSFSLSVNNCATGGGGGSAGNCAGCGGAGVCGCSGATCCVPAVPGFISATTSSGLPSQAKSFFGAAGGGGGGAPAGAGGGGGASGSSISNAGFGGGGSAGVACYSPASGTTDSKYTMGGCGGGASAVIIGSPGSASSTGSCGGGGYVAVEYWT